MALTPEQIADEAKCFCISEEYKAILFLLDQIRINGGGAVMSPNEIAESSKCYCVPDFKKAAIFLLNAILTNGGGGGGGGGVVFGSGSPVGVVTPTQDGEIYSRTDAPELWQATGLTSADWIQMV